MNSKERFLSCLLPFDSGARPPLRSYQTALAREIALRRWPRVKKRISRNEMPFVRKELIMRARAIVQIGIGTLLLTVAIPTLASGACNNGVCANSVTNGRYVSVRYRVQHGRSTHVNIRSRHFQIASCEGLGCGEKSSFQREGHGRRGEFTLLRNKAGKKILPTSFSIQPCVRGGLLASSRCEPWATFQHGTD